MKIAIVLTVLTLLMLATAYVEAAEPGYVLKLPLKPIELTDRNPLLLDVESGEILGGVYRISLTGAGNPLYAKGLFLTPNETGVVELRLEVLQGPSGYKLGVESIWMNPSWCDVHFELAAEGYAGPIKWKGLDFKPEKYVTQEEPLIIKLSIKPYAFKTALPYGEITKCYVHVRVYGNVSFGVNVREKEWSLGYPVYVMKPEENLDVEVKNPLLRFEVEPDGFIRKVFLDAELDVTNNLEGDMVLKKVWATVALGPEIAKAPSWECPGWEYESELNYIIKPGQSERISLEGEWDGYKWLKTRNGTVMIGLYYLTENGSGIKRFFYAFNPKETEKLSPQTITTASKSTIILKKQSYATTGTSRTVLSTSTSRSKPGGLADLTEYLGRIILNPVMILLVLGLVFSIASFIARRSGQVAEEKMKKASPPPSPHTSRLKQTTKTAIQRIIPRWVYGECLKIMEEKYREFRELRESGQPRYAIYALYDGLEAALKLLARESGVLGLQPDETLRFREIVNLLMEGGVLSVSEFQLIKEVAEIRNRYKHKALMIQPIEQEVDKAAANYLKLKKWFQKFYNTRPK